MKFEEMLLNSDTEKCLGMYDLTSPLAISEVGSSARSVNFTPDLI